MINEVAAHLEQLQVIRHRGRLARTLEKIGRGRLVVGFVGGSISDGRPGYTWPEGVVAWLTQAFPQCRIVVENAAIGATGSESAVFRAQRDLIDHGCDIVFIEYAVNDNGEPSLKRKRTREGLIRKCLRAAADVVLTYTFCQPMYAAMAAGQVPASVADLEELAEHYRLGSVWMGLNALREVTGGSMKWDEWLPDGIHPQYRGSLSYAQAVIGYLKRELLEAPSSEAIARGSDLPAALEAANWEHAWQLPLEAAKTCGPWRLRRSLSDTWIDQYWQTHAPGAKIAWEFSGRAISLGLQTGKLSSDFRWRLDDQPWKTVELDRPDWAGPLGWYRFIMLADDLPAGPHRLELEVLFPEKGSNACSFRLANIGVVP